MTGKRSKGLAGTISRGIYVVVYKAAILGQHGSHVHGKMHMTAVPDNSTPSIKIPMYPNSKAALGA